jgi:hypothetical protein
MKLIAFGVNHGQICVRHAAGCSDDANTYELAVSYERSGAAKVVTGSVDDLDGQPEHLRDRRHLGRGGPPGKKFLDRVLVV